MSSLFPIPSTAVRVLGKGKVDLQLLHELQCKACPLAQLNNKHGDMEPTGSEKPLVYMLGEAPGEEEDEEGEQFVGPSGDLLRARVPVELEGKLRWNNVVRTRPHDGRHNRSPTPFEIECCKPSIVRDIEKTRPKAIFGFGNIPLQWITGYSGILAYRGRKFPVRIGSHTCWYYAMLHPAFLLRQGRRAQDFRREMDPTAIGSEMERAFAFDLERAFEDIYFNYRPPVMHTPQQALAGFTLITDPSDKALDIIYKKLKWFSKQRVIGLDYETHATKTPDNRVFRPYDKAARILTAAVATGEEGLSFGFDHPGAGWSKRQRKELGEIWYEFLYDCEAIKAVHNLGYEMEWTGYFFGTELLRRGTWRDTASQANTLDERSRGTKPNPISLEFQVLMHFGINIKKLANVDASNLINTPLPLVTQYNCLDSRYHALLFDVFTEQIARDGLKKADRYRQRCVPAIAMAQLKGMPVSQSTARKLHRKYSIRLSNLAKRIKRDPNVRKFRERFGRHFNPLASKDALDLFGTILKRKELHVEVKAKDRIKAQEASKADADREDRQSATKAVLLSMKDLGDLPQNIVSTREATKRRSTYIESVMENTEGTDLWPDGLLHPQFNLFFAQTGRLSAEGPPVQQWPKRDGEAREVRKPVVAAKDCIIIAVDYGQIEARVIAMYTKDKRFCKALWDRYDIHKEWAERIAYAYPSRVGGRKMLKDKDAMKNFRTDVKNQWTFPLVFGASLKSTAEYLRIPEEHVKPLYEEFWDEFEGIRDWQKDLMKFYQKYGYVETFLGRRRRAPLSPNKVYNSPVQGVTAELVMDAFCRLSETGDPVLQAELQIHDDLTFLRVPKKRAEHYLEKIIDFMIHPPFKWINVPISVEASMGDNWLEMHEIGTYSSDQW